MLRCGCSDGTAVGSSRKMVGLTRKPCTSCWFGGGNAVGNGEFFYSVYPPGAKPPRLSLFGDVG